MGERDALRQPRRTARHYKAERDEAVKVLRRVCAVSGDNNWPDDLHLADVIDKHLEWHLPEPGAGEGAG